jgi:hypothetical protein
MVGRRLARVFIMIAALAMIGCAAMMPAGSVTLNGVVIAGAETRPDITVSIAEFREGGGGPVRLAPGLRRYAVTIVSRDPIALLESQLPADATPAKFTVGENGRTFRNCLVAGLASEGTAGGYRLLYAFRCEDVAP